MVASISQISIELQIQARNFRKIHNVEVFLLLGWLIFSTLLVLTFLVHSGIEGGHNVPPDIETPVKPQVFFQIKSNKDRKVE